MSAGFTADARRRLMVVLKIAPCPTCGHSKRPGLRGAAEWIGVAPSTLGRFLDGLAIKSDSLDRVVDYLRRKEQEANGPLCRARRAS